MPMKMLIPPVLTSLLALLSLALMTLPFPPTLQIMSSWAVWPLALLLFVTGSIIAVGGKRQFQQSDSEIHPFKQPRNLVTSGFFRYSRNPMYLGFVLMLSGIALFVNLWPALFAPLTFFLAANLWYIPHEEQAAASSFGDAYLSYCQQVRRWI